MVFDWDKIVNDTASLGTTWKFAPSATQWRNGLSERRVKAFKESVDIILPQGAQRLNYVEFYAFLVRSACLINDRPLGVKRIKNDDDTLLPITPNLLTLGRNSNSPPVYIVDPESYDRLSTHYRFVEEVLRHPVI